MKFDFGVENGSLVRIPKEGAGAVFYFIPDKPIKGSYGECANRTLSSGFSLPTGDLIAPLIHRVYCGEFKDEPKLREVRSFIQGNGIWVCNVEIPTQDGVFSVRDRNGLGRNFETETDYLDSKLEDGFENGGVKFSKGGGVAFAPRGSYNSGEMSPKELGENKIMIARFGLEGALLLADATSTLMRKPIVSGPCRSEDRGVIQITEWNEHLYFLFYAFNSSISSFENINSYCIPVIERV